MHSSNSDPRDLSHAILVAKVMEVLSAGDESADTLSHLILLFHRELRRRKQEAGAAHTGRPGQSGKGCMQHE